VFRRRCQENLRGLEIIEYLSLMGKAGMEVSPSAASQEHPLTLIARPAVKTKVLPAPIIASTLREDLNPAR
jgi:hypothetical protein